MFPRMTISIGILCLAFFSIDSRCLHAVETENESEDPAYAELIELGHEYVRLADRQEEEEERLDTIEAEVSPDASLPDEEWLKQRRALWHRFNDKAPDPDSELCPRLLSFAKKHPNSPFALGALTFVIYRGGPQTGMIGGTPWQSKEEALDLVSSKYMHDPRIVILLEQLAGSIPSTKSISFYKNAIEKAPNRTTRAAAEYHFARHLIRWRQVHRQSGHYKYKSKERLLDYQRHWHLVVTPYLKKELPYDEEKVSSEIERVLANVIDSYADVEATDYKVSGPVQLIWELEELVPRQTYAELAKSALYGMNNIVPGKQAPDTVGKDADGKQFRLSDYRGKVVLLTFSANWCGGCVELYPLQRNLVEKYRDEPFVLLSVSRDANVNTLQASIKSGKITWRCWWDGRDGRINDAWNCEGIPSLVLLDHEHVVQDVLLERLTPQEEFEQAISTLLKKATR